MSDLNDMLCVGCGFHRALTYCGNCVSELAERRATLAEREAQIMKDVAEVLEFPRGLSADAVWTRLNDYRGEHKRLEMRVAEREEEIERLKERNLKQAQEIMTIAGRAVEARAALAKAQEELRDAREDRDVYRRAYDNADATARAEALEEAAKVVDDLDMPDMWDGSIGRTDDGSAFRRNAVAAIRALAGTNG